jgi:glucose-1-phosphate adenylyltransferase
MKKVLGLINLHHSTELKVLNVRRSVASTSFLGRYAFIDFPLSNFANSDINQIGVLIKEKTRSLFRHLGVTEQVWTQNSKTGGIYLMNNELQSNNPKHNNDINNILENIWVLKNAKADLVVFAPVHFLMRVDYRKILNEHVNTKADITLLYHKLKGAKNKWLNTQTVTLNNDRVVGFGTNKGSEETQNVFLESYIISKTLLLQLIKEAKAISQFNSLQDMLKQNSKDLKILGYEHKEYVRLIDSETNFMNASLELLNLEVLAQLFKENWPIYTRTYDTPPAKYGVKAKIVNSYVANGSLVLGSVKNSIIGRDVVVEEGASVENSIIMSHVRVPANTKLNHAIIDKEAKINNGASMSGEADKPLIIKQEEKL